MIALLPMRTRLIGNRRVTGRFNPFGHDKRADGAQIIAEMRERPSSSRKVRCLSQEGTVQFDNVRLDRIQQSQAGKSGPEIVKHKRTPCFAQLTDEQRHSIEVGRLCSLGDLHMDPPGDRGIPDQTVDCRSPPGVPHKAQHGEIDAHPAVVIDFEQIDHPVHHVQIKRPDKAKPFERCNTLTR